MQSHQLQSENTSKKRIGRGGKRGTTAGRGTKGQKSRSGGNVNPLFEGGRSTLVQRMKKNRGFKSPHAKKMAISVSLIESSFDDGDVVTLASLYAKKLLRNSQVKAGVRLVAGEISKKVTVDAEIGVSASAREQIEKAGGTVSAAGEKKVVTKEVEKKEEAKPVSEVKAVEELQVQTAPSGEPDDLTKVEGIGPKISETLIAAGVTTFSALSETSSEKIQEIITDVRGNHDSETWPAQAKMAAQGKWDELEKWQDELDGGKA